MSKNKPASFTPYFTEDDAGQVRAAFMATGHQEGYASISELIEAATLREVRRLQRKYNQSREWEPAPPGTLRPGQRTREEQRRPTHPPNVDSSNSTTPWESPTSPRAQT